jgi:hypothetical protein
MITLDRVTGRNMPGLCYVDVLPIEDVLTMPEVQGGSIADPVVPLPGKQWHRIQVAPPGCLFNEKWSVANGLPVATSTVTGWTGRDELAKLQALWNLPTTRFLVLAVGRNGDAVLLGTKEEGCRAVAAERQRGTEDDPANGYQLTFSLRRADPAPFYLAELPSTDPDDECPTLAELLATTDLITLLSALPPVLYDQLAEYFAAGGGPTLAELLSITSPEDLYPLLSAAQAIYIAEQVIDEVDGGDSSTNYGDEVDGGGDPPPPTGADFDSADFSSTDFATD